jgi:hypothetical protein
MKRLKYLVREWIEELDGNIEMEEIHILCGEAERIGCVMEFLRSFFKKEGVRKMIRQGLTYMRQEFPTAWKMNLLYTSDL